MFPVDRTNRTIKGILEQAVGEAFRGREVFVEEVDPSWNYVEGGFYIVAADGKGRTPTAATERQIEQFVHPTAQFAILVFGIPEPTTRKPSHRTATIFVPQLDHVQMDVARDALLAGDKAMLDELLKPFGLYAGIARAILERQARSFKQAAHPKKSTKQIRREVDDFLRSQGRL